MQSQTSIIVLRALFLLPHMTGICVCDLLLFCVEEHHLPVWNGN